VINVNKPTSALTHHYNTTAKHKQHNKLTITHCTSVF